MFISHVWGVRNTVRIAQPLLIGEGVTEHRRLQRKSPSGKERRENGGKRGVECSIRGARMAREGSTSVNAMARWWTFRIRVGDPVTTRKSR